MTNREIFDKETEFEPWLKWLLKPQEDIILRMMGKARQQGYDSGMKDAHSSFQDEISYRGWK
jgi:hypothetical protein